jgi:hypothetical protein
LGGFEDVVEHADARAALLERNGLAFQVAEGPQMQKT